MNIATGIRPKRISVRTIERFSHIPYVVDGVLLGLLLCFRQPA